MNQRALVRAGTAAVERAGIDRAQQLDQFIKCAGTVTSRTDPSATPASRVVHAISSIHIE
jgi:hypothetical protein